MAWQSPSAMGGNGGGGGNGDNNTSGGQPQGTEYTLQGKLPVVSRAEMPLRSPVLYCFCV